MYFTTPLRYPGGKGKLTNFIKLVFEQNDLLDGQYVEPYAGGSGIAINLLLHQYVSRIHLNDLNVCVYAFWKSVVERPDELCRMIRDVDLDMETWFAQRAITLDPSNHSLLELGFATFFLNRTNRSGILRGGVIGGKNQDGPWKLDARFTKPDLIKRVEAIALYGSRIRLYNLDAKILIREVLPNIGGKALVYLDPPYYVKGGELYENHYEHDDHVTIAALVTKTIKQPWIVSYDHAPEISALYTKCPTITYGINYSAHNRFEGAEVMFFSTNLVIPDVSNPAKLKAG